MLILGNMDVLPGDSEIHLPALDGKSPALRAGAKRGERTGTCRSYSEAFWASLAGSLVLTRRMR
jgi:hypothetical protein